MERNGYPEETYYTFSYSPMPNDEGGTGGIICANTDDTQRIIGERQLALLRELAAAHRRRAHRARRPARAAPRCARRQPARSAVRADLPGWSPSAADASLAGAAGHRARPPGRAGRRSRSTDRRPGRSPRCCAHPERAVVSDLRARARAAADRRLAPAADAGGRAADLASGRDRPRRRPGRRASTRSACSTTTTEGFLGLVAGQIAAAIANAQAYEEERRRAEALAELDRAKTAFFSNVSHEFRTPLTLMLGPLEDVLAGAAGRCRRASASAGQVAHRNGLRLLKLVNTLLDFSRIEAGRVQAALRADRPGRLHGRAGQQLPLGHASGRGCGSTCDCPPLPEPVYVDRDMWEKIVLNLLSNAFKFTLEGEIAVALRRGGRRQRRADVRDTGTGIPAEELPRLFERFHRVEGARGRTHEGTRHRSGAGPGAGAAARRHRRGREPVGPGSAFTVSFHSARPICRSGQWKRSGGASRPRCALGPSSRRRPCAGFPVSKHLMVHGNRCRSAGDAGR